MDMQQQLSSASPKKQAKVRRNDPAQWLPSYLTPFVQYSHGEDFFISPRFDPTLIVQLMAEGFLPIATSNYLLPKLHKERSVIHPIFDKVTSQCLVHTSHSTMKKCKRFLISVNQDFDEVVNGCHQHHGISWLFPPLVQSFKYIHQQTLTTPMMATIFSDGTPNIPIGQCQVRLYSIEVWDSNTGELVAGEIGYSVGNIYTSLTGFTLADSAGSVQLAALGGLLCQHGFETWDLGMDLEYKQKLGARKLDRSDFVSLVKESRSLQQDIKLPRLDKQSCKTVMKKPAAKDQSL